MKPVRTPLPLLPRLLILAGLLLAGAARASDYSDVTQLLHEGKPDEALTKAERFIAAKPRDPQMRFLKGVILSETGHPAEAIDVFTALTQEYPELPEPYNNLAALYAAQDQLDKARAALEMAVRINPGYATAYENLGDIYVRLAAQAYAQAQQLDTTSKSIPPKLTLARKVFAPPAAAPDKAAVR